ncbi:unnamed protein product [Phytomonas sp. EM1]|nr:unnamed protein product [Phytomonas sp. EM1]|eukprot:CCW61512.1 unnamed protein product [Phytomonas sp. isolate EM1]
MQAINPSDPQIIKEFDSLAACASSIHAADREISEKKITEFQNNVDQQSGFVVLLLQIAASGSPTAPFCSIVLKNTVKRCWDPSSAEHCIQDVDKSTIRELIIGVMLQAEVSVQRNLAEAISLIANVDFPAAWPNALATIVQTLESASLISVKCAALSTAHSILVKYRENATMTETYVKVLRGVYASFSLPLVNAMMSLLGPIEHGPTAEATMACKGFAAAVECILDISVLDMTEELLAHNKTLVKMFLRCLSAQNPALTSNRYDGGALVEMKSVVTLCVSHFMNVFDQDFEDEVPEFLEMVWNMLASPLSVMPAMDDLVIQGLELLSRACAGIAQKFFADEARVNSLLENVVIPNLMLREEDEDVYHTEPDAYIQRDIEGSDLHTRRRAAGELVRSLMKNVPNQSRPLLSNEVNRLLLAGLTDWRAKDAGIYLASSLALEGHHVDSSRGVSHQQLSNMIPLSSFLSTTILPELEFGISAISPAIIKADCMRVVTTFRNHIDPTLIPKLLESLPKWLSTNDWVLMSYSAHMCERMMLVQFKQQNVVTEAVFRPLALTVLQALCVAIQQTEQPNAYIARCLMRIFLKVPGAIVPYAGDVVVTLNTVIQKGCRNPSNPVFNHCVFEVLSKCITLQPDQVQIYEHILWDSIHYILANDVLEFVPYVLQILSQLLHLHPAGEKEPPEHYRDLLEPLMEPSLYEQKGNIPAAVCLLTEFIEHYPEYVHQTGGTVKLLHIFHFLVHLKNYDHEGLNILTSLMLSYPHDVMGNYLSAALQVLLQRLQTAKTPKYVRILIIFLSITVCVRSAEDLVHRMEEIQYGLFFMILSRVWLPNMQKITGTLERKICVVALAKLLCDSESLQQNPQMWAESVFSCLRMIHDTVEEDDRSSFSPREVTLNDLTQTPDEGFTNAFCPLQEAVRKPVDVCQTVTDANQYFKEHIKELLSGRGAPLMKVLQEYLSPQLLALIQ